MAKTICYLYFSGFKFELFRKKKRDLQYYPLKLSNLSEQFYKVNQKKKNIQSKIIQLQELVPLVTWHRYAVFRGLMVTVRGLY